MEPIAAWDLTERASPWAAGPASIRRPTSYRERLDPRRLRHWLRAGLRCSTLRPDLPVEVAHYIPRRERMKSHPSRTTPTFDRRRIYLLDRNSGLDILEMHP